MALANASRSGLKRWLQREGRHSNSLTSGVAVLMFTPSLLCSCLCMAWHLMSWQVLSDPAARAACMEACSRHAAAAPNMTALHASACACAHLTHTPGRCILHVKGSATPCVCAYVRLLFAHLQCMHGSMQHDAMTCTHSAAPFHSAASALPSSHAMTDACTRGRASRRTHGAT